MNSDCKGFLISLRGIFNFILFEIPNDEPTLKLSGMNLFNSNQCDKPFYNLKNRILYYITFISLC